MWSGSRGPEESLLARRDHPLLRWATTSVHVLFQSYLRKATFRSDCEGQETDGGEMRSHNGPKEQKSVVESPDCLLRKLPMPILEPPTGLVLQGTYLEAALTATYDKHEDHFDQVPSLRL